VRTPGFALAAPASLGKPHVGAMRKLPVVPTCRSYPHLWREPETLQVFCHPAPPGGAYCDRHETWGAGAADGSPWQTNDGARTAKLCGPGISTLMPSFAERSARRRWQTSPITGESAEQAVKPSCGECRTVSVNLWWLCLRASSLSHARQVWQIWHSH